MGSFKAACVSMCVDNRFLILQCMRKRKINTYVLNVSLATGAIISQLHLLSSAYIHMFSYLWVIMVAHEVTLCSYSDVR